MKLTIGKKILFGYIPVILVIVIIASVSLFGLRNVGQIAERISTDVIQTRILSESLLNNLNKREFDVRKAQILEDQRMIDLIRNSSAEYRKELVELVKIADEDSDNAKLLQQFDSSYTLEVEHCLLYVDAKDTLEVATSDKRRNTLYKKQQELLIAIKEGAAETQRVSSEQIVVLVHKTFRRLWVSTLVGLILSALVAMIITQFILHSVRKLKKASIYVAEGEFHQLPTVKSDDELGDLSRSFNEMAHRLYLLEETYKDASPLTRLPGGIAVESAVQQRIEKGVPFGFCMLDLDNFKPFNDRYGYSHGNTVIKKTAEIVQKVTRRIGTPNDFVGHIGGDDFVVVSTPEYYQEICEEIIRVFDTEIINFYEEEDVERGFIISKSRQGETLEFPIMTISISAVDSTLTKLTNYIQVGEEIADLKKYAKSFATSKFVVDRREIQNEKKKKGVDACV